MREHKRALGAYADRVIASCRNDPPRAAGPLAALMAAQTGGRSLTPQELRGHVLGLFLAGNETTAAALGWALVHAARNRDEWARLRGEPDRVRPFIDETLRVTPPVWGMTRTPTHGHTQLQLADGAVRVRRPEVVTIYLRGMNHNAARWPDPSRFNPDRHVTLDRARDRAVLPFGLGPRSCTGQHLALAEMTAALPALARHGDIEITGDVHEDASFALRVQGGLRGRFVSRGSIATP